MHVTSIASPHVFSLHSAGSWPYMGYQGFTRSENRRDHGDHARSRAITAILPCSPFTSNQVLTPSRHRFPKEEIPVKYLFAVILLAALSPLSFAQETSEIATPPNGDNQKAEVSQWIGPVKISIQYHSPHVHNPPTKDRTGHIWGELVHYGFFDEGFGPTKGAPWRAGANESTSITFSNDVKVEGKDLKAGTY